MLRRGLTVFAICALLVACVSSVDELRKSNLKGNNFQTELAKQYLDFAEAEADQYDWLNSSYFAKKGLKAINGENVQPEDLKSWKIPEDILPTMSQARDYLVSVIKPDVTAKFPEQAARAQFMFDCWVEKQEENWKQSHIDYCREEFYGTLDRLFALTAKTAEIAPPEKPKIEIVKPNPAPVSAPVQETKLAYFRTGSATLDKGVKRLINNVIARLKDVKSYDITLNGYADMVGGEESNMKLSKKRAMAIKRELVKAGINEKAVTIFAFGSTQGRVKASKGAPSRGNRVVEMVIDIK